jgi:hypothetical protein
LLKITLSEFQKVLNFTNVASMATLQQYNQLILLADGKLRTYVLHTFASMIQQQPMANQLGTSMELLSEPSDVVSYFAAGPMLGGTLSAASHLPFLDPN